MEIQYLTENACYKTGSSLKPKGVMVHSTGANNPNVKRYVPGNERMGYNTTGNHWNVYKPGGRKVCVHGFLGKFDNGTIDFVQTLPWDMRGWHAGGNANNTHIGFEICEDGLDSKDYFNKIYEKAIEVVSMLCLKYNLDPKKDGVVICHSEGYARGIASNHADVMHWWPKFGKTMADFRNDVKDKMEDEDMTQEKFNEMMEVYLAQRAAQEASMPALVEDAKKMGLTDGFRPMSFVTREECAVMARAAALYKEG